MAIEEKTKILFVTGASAVSDFLYKMFSNKTDKYYIEGSSSTRENAVKTCNRKEIDIVIFFEKAPGTISLSETVYKMRVSGARVIFITSQRNPGDLLLETLVGYGVYDIILSSKITSNQLMSFVESPRHFNDVSIFHRQVDVADTGIGNKNFKIPDINYLSNFSKHLTEDYLSTSTQRNADNAPSYINKNNDSVKASDKIYKTKQKKTGTNKKNNVQNKPQEKVSIGGLFSKKRKLVDIDDSELE